jgi:hypothetical protein
LTRVFSSTVRILVKVGSAALLLLLSVSISQAAPDSRRSAAVCEAHAKAVRKLVRHPKAFGGPLAKVQRGPIRTDLTARLHRHQRAVLDGDDAAIQNDTPAAHLDADERPVFGLRPLGVLVGSIHFHARTRAFSPRSPRGPPTAA